MFGAGQFARIAELVSPLGRSVLVVYNGAPANVARLKELLSSANIRCQEFRQRGETKVADVDEALAAARGSACNVVVGLGGGSPIDCAKAVAALLGNGGSALDYMEVVGRGQKISQPAVPWIAVPTTAGTGAEVTRNAVIGAPERRFKASIRGPQLLARVALIDPELGLATPPAVTANSGMDALCQCIESYTSTGAQPITDALALHGIALAARALPRAYADGADLRAREEMCLAALLSGITLTNAGLGAVHGFAAPLGANFPAPHGAICAGLLPDVIRANVNTLRALGKEQPVLSRYAAIGRALHGSQALGEDEAIDAAANHCAKLASTLAIQPLRTFGISDRDILPMVELAKKSSSMRFNPVVLADAVLADVLRQAL